MLLTPHFLFDIDCFGLSVTCMRSASMSSSDSRDIRRWDEALPTISMSPSSSTGGLIGIENEAQELSEGLR